MKSKLLTKIVIGGCFAVMFLALLPHCASAQTGPPEEVHGQVAYADPVTGMAWHFYRMPLAHTTPDFILDEIKQAYRPRTGGNDGMAELTKGKSDYGITSSPPGFGMLIPNRRDNSLLLFATVDGYETCKTMIRVLDIPAIPPITKHPVMSKPKPVQRHK